MNPQFRKRSYPTRVLLYILIIGVMLSLAVITGVSAYTITATAGSGGAIEPGSVFVSPGANSPPFFITLDPGYHIDVMTIDGTVIPANPAPQISNVNSDHTISVTFAPDQGSVLVRSDPNGATIFIDGVESGTTPNTVDHVPVGTRQLRLALAGYTDYTGPIVVERDETTNVPKITLYPLASTPTSTQTPTPTSTPTTTPISVSSTPSGATVYLDGTNKGTTPLTIPSVTYGSHNLRLTYPGYQDSSNAVTVSASSHTYTYTLILTPTTTPILVSSTPSGATVYLDGSNKGTTPLTIPSVTYGSHNLRLTYPGYQDSSNAVTVSASSHTYVYTLTPTPTTTPISVSSTPSGATVYLDGSNKGTTPLTISSVTYGSHNLRLTYPGYQDSSNAVTVSASSYTYAYTLTPTPVGTTTPISVSSTPSGATVYLDGSNKGTTPLTIPTVPFGVHNLRLTYPGYQDSSNVVTVSASSYTYAYTLTPTPGGTTIPISVSSTPSGATVYLDGTNKGTTPLTIPSVTYGSHNLRLTYPEYHESDNEVSVSASSYTYAYTLTPTGQIYVVVTGSTTIPTTVPTTIQTLLPNTTVTPATNITQGPVTPVVNESPNAGLNNTSVLEPVGTSPQETRANGSANVTGTGLQPPAGLASWNVIIFLFIAVIPLVLLLAHDYLGIGHLSFPQPLAVRAGVAVGQVACGTGLIFALSRMIALLPALTNTLTLPLMLIVLLLGAYLIFSALALAVGSLLSRPLRWTLKVHVVIGVIVLIVTPILLFSLGQGEVMAILVTIVAAPVSALLALWQDHSLSLQVQQRGFPYGFFNGDETRVPTGTDPYRRSTATRPDIFPPELADRYTSIDFLGMGGISHVFRAMRLKDGMTVAVKIPIRFDETTGKSFMKEILAWEGLRHPNIAEITEVNILPIPYVEMEFCKSVLSDLKTPLPVNDAVEIVNGVASGLAYAHEQGIIHRDIKPQNILIDSNGVPKISDWGMSRLIGSSAIPTIAGFSLAYAAPEQISPGRFGETDERTDIYQLGVVFYELVTGKLLFPGDDLADVSNAIISRMPVPPSDINPLARPLDPIILKCLQKDPGARYQSVRTLLEDLKRFLDSQHDTGDSDPGFDWSGAVE